MTYVPVNPEERKGHGRPPAEIPDALLKQLQHSKATGARCVIELTEQDSEDDIAALKRLLVRAAYRHFGENTIFKKRTGTEFRFWVGPRQKRGQRNREKDSE